MQTKGGLFGLEIEPWFEHIWFGDVSLTMVTFLSLISIIKSSNNNELLANFLSFVVGYISSYLVDISSLNKIIYLGSKSSLEGTKSVL